MGLKTQKAEKNRKEQKEQITTYFEFLDRRNIEKEGK